MGIKIRDVSKTLGRPPAHILSGINFDIADGDYVAVTGRSGSGKSSLLYLLSTLDTVTAGEIEIDGKSIGRMTSDELNYFRNTQAGFVFQFHYLLSELSALENVLLPAEKTHQTEKRRAYAAQLLDQVGLGEKMRRFPRELSGGEQQRVAIARALVMEPRYLFADEPTGSLDSENSETVLRIMEETNRSRHTTLILVTHETSFARRAKHQIRLVDGRLA